MVTKKSKQRNRDATKEKILRAARRILAVNGFRKIGVNAVAREAGVDKVLIYRYFGGIPGLLGELSGDRDFWPSVEDLLGDAWSGRAEMPIREISIAIIKGRLRELLKRPETMEVLRWEQVERNALTDRLHRDREAQGWELFNLLPGLDKLPKGMDLEAIAALAIAGVTYLALRSKTADTFQGVDLHSPEGWARIDRAVEEGVSAYFDYFERRAANNSAVKKGKKK
jgi:AcrR family transcriptional regulator